MSNERDKSGMHCAFRFLYVMFKVVLVSYVSSLRPLGVPSPFGGGLGRGFNFPPFGRD